MIVSTFEKMVNLVHEMTAMKYLSFEKTIKTPTGWLYYNSPCEYFFEFDTGGVVAKKGDKILIALDGKEIVLRGEFNGRFFIEPTREATKRKTVFKLGVIDGKDLFMAPFSSGVYIVATNQRGCLDDDEPARCRIVGTVIKFPSPIRFQTADMISKKSASYDGHVIEFDEKKIKRLFENMGDIISNYGFI